jgi:ATP-dependent Lhr-like helicase
LAEAHIKTWRWHGDVPANQKKKLLERPSGILQITPESLEAMMIRHTGDIAKLFNGLRYIIIDEIHAFMGTDRGGQLFCQITKIERWAKCKPRRVGLSATLNNLEDAAAWLGSGSNTPVECVAEKNTRKQVRLAVDWFAHEVKAAVDSGDDELPNTTKSAFYDEIYKQCRDTKSIIFTNSRSGAEETIANMRSIAKRRREQDVFHVHHACEYKVFK